MLLNHFTLSFFFFFVGKMSSKKIVKDGIGRDYLERDLKPDSFTMGHIQRGSHWLHCTDAAFGFVMCILWTTVTPGPVAVYWAVTTLYTSPYIHFRFVLQSILMNPNWPGCWPMATAHVFRLRMFMKASLGEWQLHWVILYVQNTYGMFSAYPSWCLSQSQGNFLLK